jgi:predicted MFS family arabinose efflux permease
MGTVQTAFAASQVLGLPVGLALAAHWGWHAPFWLIVAISVPVGAAMVVRLRPIDAHLAIATERNAFRHLLHTATRPRYLVGFSATMLLATGGFMLMPFGSAFAVGNLGVPLTQLPLVTTVAWMNPARANGTGYNKRTCCGRA